MASSHLGAERQEPLAVALADLEWQLYKADGRFANLTKLVLKIIADLLEKEPISYGARVRLAEIADTLTKIEEKEFDG